mmetsp:Transcript_111096/g.293434  ORF Transcript_111096/g.293434 Transcript_111096/m.293434 type:complete len:208 (+) Transcript_111096:314-937(+)
MLEATSSVMPVMMSTGILMIAVGSAAAMSSIDVPPTLLPIMRGPPLPRSIRMAKYFSSAMDTFSASSRVLLGLPSAPVCLVTSVFPSIFSANSETLPLGTMCTPPWKPFSLKWPRPLPPASTCAFTTTSSPGMLLAFSTASGTEKAGRFFGTPTPYFWKMICAWYSCRFRNLRCTAPTAGGTSPRWAARRPRGAAKAAADMARDVAA